MLRATEEIGEIEKGRVREEAKAEVLAAKKDLRTLSKRMDQQCTREVGMHVVQRCNWNNAEYIAVMALLGLIHEACRAIPVDKQNPNNMYICILYRCAKPSRPQVDSMLALAAEKEKSEQLEARVNILEQEVRNTCSFGGGGWYAEITRDHRRIKLRAGLCM